MLKHLAIALTLIVLAAPAARTLAAADAPGHTTTTPPGTTAGPTISAPPAGAATGHDTAEGHDGEHKGSLVDVPFAQAIWVVVIFLIVLILLYPTAWKNILAGLKTREQRIRTDIADAEAARGRAEATLKEYNTQLATAEQKVRDLIATATADAERMAAQIRARGETEATEAKDRATKEIEAAKKQALAQIYEQTAQLATSVAEKILRRSINADDQRDLVSRSLDEVGNIKNN